MDKEVFINSCNDIIKNNGRCGILECKNCPFSYLYNNGKKCTIDYTNNLSPNEKDDKLYKSAIFYLKENDIETKLENNIFQVLTINLLYYYKSSSNTKLKITTNDGTYFSLFNEQDEKIVDKIIFSEINEWIDKLNHNELA